MENQRAFKTAVLVEVNHHILDAALDSITREQEWEFFCECGRPTCTEHVSMTIDAFASLEGREGAVVAPGHRMTAEEQVTRAEHARLAADRLRGEAVALVSARDQRGSRRRRARPTGAPQLSH